MVTNNKNRLEIDEGIVALNEELYDLHYHERKYKQAILKALELKTILETNVKQNKIYLWNCYNILSKASLQLNNIDEAIKYAKISNWYAEDGSVERVDTMDVLARCYSQINGKKELAMKCFDKCLSIYRNTNMIRGIARILNNKASFIVDYDNAITDMLEAINIYIDLYNKKEIETYYIIDAAYYNLCEIYIKKNKEGKVYGILDKIKDDRLKSDIRNMLKALNVQQQKVVGI
jgi:tetratricopeptide (TPR) repeat protein